jgi:DHA1 family tetracycline resistance protein-like MFS transporter
MDASGRKPLPPGFGVIWTTVVIDLIGFGIVLPILPLYAERFGAGAATATAIVAAFSFAQFVAAPLWGRLSDRIGRKPVLVMALCGSAIGALLTGLAGALPLLFLGRLIDGASGSSYAVAQAAATDLADPRDRPRLLGLLGAAFGVGFVAGPIIGGIAALGGHRLPFFIASAFAAANAVATLVRVPETHRPGTASPAPAGARRFVPPTRVFREAGGRIVLRLIVLALVGMAAFSGFESTFALLMNRRFDAENGVIYTLFAAIGLVLVFVQARLIGQVHHRWSSTTVLRAALASNAVGMGILAIDGGWGTLVPALLFLTVGQGLLGPTLSSSIAGAAPGERRGEALGLQQSASALGRVIGPLGAGALFSAVGVGSPYLVAAALLVAAVALVPSLLAAGPARYGAPVS